MRILMTDFHRLWGGQAAYVIALCRELARRNHDVTVGCVAGSLIEERSRNEGLKVFTGCRYDKGFAPLSRLRDIRATGRFLREAGTEILHANGSQDHWAGAIAAWRSHPATRVLRTKHNSYVPHGTALNRLLYRRLTAQVLTVADALRGQFVESGLLPAERIASVHAPVSDAFLCAAGTKRVLREEWGLAEDALLIGYVGRLHPDKGPQVLMDAAPKLLGADPRRHLAYVGIGHLEHELPARAKSLGLADRIHFPGFRSDMVPVMASFDVLVLPSLSCDASSTVLKEAMALEVPVVATRVGGACEIVEDGESGSIVPPGDVGALAAAIERVLGDADLRARMGRAGSDRVRRSFAVGVLAEKIEAIYRRVLDSVPIGGG